MSSSARRTARLRREFLYRKSLEGPEAAAWERRERLRTALAAGAPLPSDLRGPALAPLRDALEREDVSTAAAPRTHVDDEYGAAGRADYVPRVALSTSRDPSARLRAFAVEVRLLFPGGVRMNRGKTGVAELVAAAREAGATDLLLLQETRGEPDALIVSHLPHGPTAYFSLSGAVLRHDLAARGTVSEAAPHLIFANFATKLGARVRAILTALFPAAKPDARRVLTFSNDADFISFRHHVYDKAASARPGAPLDRRDVTLTEVGPRFELHPYMIRLGTLDQDEAETERALRSFTNTARKSSAL